MMSRLRRRSVYKGRTSPEQLASPQTGASHLSLILAFVAIAAILAPTHRPVRAAGNPLVSVPAATGATQVPIALGAYISGAPWDPTLIDQYTALVGAAPSTVMWYQDWAHPGVRDFDPVKMNAVVARGAMPLITWEPWDYTAGGNQPAYSARAIARGAYDPFIRDWARAAAGWGKPFYLRFAHEMNGNWYPWAVGVNGNTGADYTSMWKHVRRIFAQEGAANVRWVWSPNVAYPGSSAFADSFPGDNAVDWVGLDGYNWGTSQLGKQWTSFVATFNASYTAVAQLTGRPMMIGETASTELGGDKAAWITQGLLTDLPAHFPRIRAVIWFDENKESDWRVDSSATALAAYRQVVSSPLYQGHLS